MAKPIKKQRWTNIDAFGLLNGISTWDKNYRNLRYVRIPDETNIELRDKINRIRENPVVGISHQDLINGLSNELLFDSYNVQSKSSFTLSRTPWPSGNVDTQDIWLSYQPPNETGWYDVFPQVWASGCEVTPTSGFIVWEDYFFRDGLEADLKTHNYSKLLTVYDDVPDKSLLQVRYYTKSYDTDNNEIYTLFTDIGYNEESELYFRLPYPIESGDLSDKVVAYNLDNIPVGLSGFYYDSEGKATSNLYKIRDVIDKNYRHRWKNIRDNETIWDVHKEYSVGTIPSFYDTHVTVDTSGNMELTGGVEYQDHTLYIQNIHVQPSGDNEYWYPVLSCGKLYCSGIPYYLMENPQYSTIEFTSGSGTLPSGIKRWHTTTMMSSGSMNHYTSEFILPTHNYSIPYKTNFDLDISGYIESSDIYRKRPYLTSDMGYDISLSDKEYMIDYSNQVVYSSGIDSAVMFWDETDIPSGHICDNTITDLNPLNESSISYDRYFMVLTNSGVI